MASVVERVTNIIKANRVAAYTKSHCHHSAATKSALSAASVPFHAEDIDLWSPDDMKAAQDYFEQTTGARTVPRVYIDGACIGGNSDFQKLYVSQVRSRSLHSNVFILNPCFDQFWRHKSSQQVKMASVKELIYRVIDENKVAVFSETHCASCVALKKTLADAGIPFHAEELDKWDPADKQAALEYLREMTGERTVPRVFVEGRAVGGNREFQNEFVQGGRLSELRGA